MNAVYDTTVGLGSEASAAAAAPGGRAWNIDEVGADEGRDGRGEQPEGARVRRAAKARRAGGDRLLDRRRHEQRVGRQRRRCGAAHLGLRFLARAM
jgi:hypothetical protein